MKINKNSAAKIKGLIIRFGLGCDGAVVEGMRSAFGEVTTGPKGLLRLLETRLGFPTDNVSISSRLVQYHECLRQADKIDHFYHHSFAADSFAVARTLLQWRDEWYASGWSGFFSDSAPLRLRAMAEVELTASNEVSLNEGQRLQRVLIALGTRDVAISRIELIDALQYHSHLWRLILEKLRDQQAVELVVLAPQQGACKEKSDLQALQAALLAGHPKDGCKAVETTDKYRFTNDGSVLILRGSYAPTIALAVAHLCQRIHQHAPDQKIALLAEREGYELNSAFEHSGLPWPGFSAVSPWRPAFQVLPLVFELLWQPLNPHVLLQLLAHPVGPIPKDIREKLASIVANEPGVGGSSWNEAINLWSDESDGDKGKAQRRASIRYWLESERYNPDDGMPFGVVIERAERVADWLQSYISWLQENSQDVFTVELYQAALSQAKELKDVVQLLASDATDKKLEREALRHLIEEVRGSGIDLVDRFAQIDAAAPFIYAINSPAACAASVDISIWWNCQLAQRSARYPWFPAERAALEAADVHLHPEALQLEWQGHSWLQPILTAKQQLVLLFNEASGQRHPIWDQIHTLVDNFEEIAVENWIIEGSSKASASGAVTLGNDALGYKSIPSPSRWWQLPEHIVFPKREAESYSSLDKFINSPYQWVLSYHARLHSGSLMAVSDDNLLKGNLAHRLYERFFGEYLTFHALTDAAIATWARTQLPVLVETSGAVLLLPGRLSEKEQFLSTVTRSLLKLVMLLRAAGVTKVLMEHAVSGDFSGGKLTGSIDMIVTNATGKEAVIDIKWGGFKYRRASFEEDNYLQLATYAHMRQQSEKMWPVLAYFIIDDARMLALDTDYFPAAVVVKPISEESTAALWQRIEQTWKWRRQQLDKGLIEVSVDGTEPSEESAGGVKCLTMNTDSPNRYNDFEVLTLSKAYIND